MNISKISIILIHVNFASFVICHFYFQMVYEHTNREIEMKKYLPELQKKVIEAQQYAQVKVEKEPVEKLAEIVKGSNLNAASSAAAPTISKEMQSVMNMLSSMENSSTAAIAEEGEDAKTKILTDINLRVTNFKRNFHQFCETYKKRDKTHVNSLHSKKKFISQEVTNLHAYLMELMRSLDKTTSSQLENFLTLQRLIDLQLKDVDTDIEKSQYLISQLQKRIAIKQNSKKLIETIKAQYANAGNNYVEKLVQPEKAKLVDLTKTAQSVLESLEDKNTIDRQVIFD